MNGQTRKHNIKCLTCDEEIKEPLSSYFAETHITANPGYVEYVIVIEMPSAKAPDSKPTMVFDGAKKH